MLNIYKRYIIGKFFIKFFNLIIIFVSLIFILNLLEEINFFKNSETNFLYPYYLTILNIPINLFEIFPFIFILTIIFLYYDLIKNDELNLLKQNGISNLNIIIILFILAIIIGLINIFIFYNSASKLKFYYTDLKNSLSNDNKYLAMVNDSGLWIKDEIDNKIFIIKSKNLKKNYLNDVIINELDKNFNFERVIISKKIDIKNFEWTIFNPNVIRDNLTTVDENTIILKTNFNDEKIKNLFSNVSTLNIFELFNLKKDFKKIGYSQDDITLHLLKIFTTPIMYGFLTVFSVIIMLNFFRGGSFIFCIILGVSLSVILYYVFFIFNSLGANGKIPLNVSIIFPLFIVSMLSLIGLVKINEK
jgi:lipopolysaccharide export system permease protein